MSHIEINRNLISKKVDNFYTSFYSMPENLQNILGRQVISVERPTIQFNAYDMYNKGVKRTGNNKIDFQAISIQFADDDQSLASRSLIEQVKRQNGIDAPSFEDSKFELNVKVFNAEEDNVEEFTLKRCFILTITHSESVMTDSINNTINVVVQFDGVDYKFPELDISL
jgi:translation elongation factor EF-G